MKISHNIRIIETYTDGIVTKMLRFEFINKEYLKALFTPKLENIGFVVIDKSITVNLKNPTYRPFFNEWIERLLIKFDQEDSVDLIIDKFNLEIKLLILFGQKEKVISVNSAKGLYAELLVLNKCLESKMFNSSKILDGWNRPLPSNHDFEFDDSSIEVKAISRNSTRVKITSEYQLVASKNKSLKLNILKIDFINKSNVDSLGNLYIKIRNLLEIDLVNIFEMKCAEDYYFSYLGPEFMPLNYKFNLLDDETYFVNQDNFPRIKKEKIDNGISKVSYSIDISALIKFKINGTSDRVH